MMLLVKKKKYIFDIYCILPFTEIEPANGAQNIGVVYGKDSIADKTAGRGLLRSKTES